MCVCVCVGGTIAYLIAQTDPVVNTFTPSNVAVELTETTGDNYTVIPGFSVAKDPTVKVTNDVDAYVFVKVVAHNFVTVAGNYIQGFSYGSSVIDFSIADEWTLYTEGTDNTYQKDGAGTPGGWYWIYYRVVKADDANKEFSVLMDNKITFSADLTAEDIANIETLTNYTSQPHPWQLNFTAYAIQYEGFANNVAGAWAAIK